MCSGIVVCCVTARLSVCLPYYRSWRQLNLCCCFVRRPLVAVRPPQSDCSFATAEIAHTLCFLDLCAACYPRMGLHTVGQRGGGRYRQRVHHLRGRSWGCARGSLQCHRDNGTVLPGTGLGPRGPRPHSTYRISEQRDRRGCATVDGVGACAMRVCECEVHLGLAQCRLRLWCFDSAAAPVARAAIVPLPVPLL